MKMIVILFLGGALMLASQGAIVAATTATSAPATQDPNGDADQDGLTNDQEFVRGGDPNNRDTDDDGVLDGQDAVVYEKLLKHPPVAETKYVVIDIGPGSANQINDSGEVLYASSDITSGNDGRVWQRGTWTSLGFHANAMNNSGLVVGGFNGPHPGDTFSPPGWEPGDDDYPQFFYPVRWVNGQMQDLTEYFPHGYPNWPRGEFFSEDADDVLSSGEILGHAIWERIMNEPTRYYGIIDMPADAGPNRSIGFTKYASDAGTDTTGEPFRGYVAEPGTSFQNVGKISCRNDMRPVYHSVFAARRGYGDVPIDPVYNIDHCGYTNSWIDLSGATLCVHPLPTSNSPPYVVHFPVEMPGMAENLDVPVVLITDRYRQVAGPALAVLRDGQWQRTAIVDSSGSAPACYTTAVNKRGEILMNTGSGEGYYANDQALIWHNGHAENLDRLIGNPDVWHINGAMDVNANGVIAAVAVPTATTGDAYPAAHVVMLVPAELLPDTNHDRKIDHSDAQVTTNPQTGKPDPFFFWINDDIDSGDTEGDDIPGQVTRVITDVLGNPTTLLPNNLDANINGVRDLVDFFPVWLNIRQLLKVLPPEQFDYQLRDVDGSVNFCETTLKANSVNDNEKAGAYLTDIATARSLAGGTTKGVRTPGVSLSAGFLGGIKGDETGQTGIILVEGRRASNAPLQLQVFSRASSAKLCSMELRLNIAPVEKMYRQKSFRAGAEVADSLGEPSGLPDRECSAKDFVFVHGYNVSAEAARGWGAEMFKRMYWSGSRARFYNTFWNGDQYGTDIAVVGHVTPNFHANVENAFAAAPAFAQFVNGLSAEVTLAAHSLGCMLTADAMSDWGANASQLFMIDAAVTMEAFDGSLNTDLNMVPPPWQNTYSFRLRASDWWRLFPTSDGRSKLTWKDRLGNVPAAALFNFYSSSEDVLQTHPSDMNPTQNASPQYAWALQEKLKGAINCPDVFNAPFLLLGYDGPVQGSTYGGWAFNDYYLDDDLHLLPPAQADNLPVSKLIGHPFYSPTYALADNGASHKWTPSWLPYLFGSNGSASAVSHRDQLLAEMIPARVLPAGANHLAKVGTFHNYDMPNEFKTDFVDWKRFRPTDEWRHSDVKSIAYPYMYKLFDQFVGEGDLQ